MFAAACFCMTRHFVLNAQEYAENIRVERRGIASAVWSVIGPPWASVAAL